MEEEEAAAEEAIRRGRPEVSKGVKEGRGRES